MRVPCAALGTALLLVSAASAPAQEASTGLEVAGLPALGYDSDEGYGYGVLAEVYQYGDGSRAPYVWTLQPKIYLTTRGRRDVTLFFDAPGLLAEDWRVSGYLGLERWNDAPYYGLGNASPYIPSLDDPDGPDPHFYSYGRLRRIARVDLQRGLGGTPLRGLFGVGLASNEIDPVPRDVGTTVLAAELGDDVQEYWTSFVRAGVVWDTRDRETAPRSGTWSELLVQWVDESLGADVGFTRWTAVHRRYVSLSERLVLAHRYVLQGVSGDAPVEQLQRIETSFEEGEGLGGSSSVRGLLKNRYTGKGLLVWNAELRWRVVDFSLIGRQFHVAASAFLDHGRVWSGAPRLRELLSDLHRGYGGGLHGGMGESFVASLYAGTSAETGIQIYLGLGYPY
ncbi:MAG TPA: BamA/TamA family outer membrane protein [Longimicrobiales bacterium]|nr:BamA/TamA family outer membrane protein [Longimicrobiales bacterium]